MDDLVLKIEVHAEEVFERMLPHIELSLKQGLLSEEEAEDLLVEEIVETIEVRSA